MTKADDALQTLVRAGSDAGNNVHHFPLTLGPAIICQTLAIRTMEDQDLTQISWRDPAFLQHFGLGEHNVMDYFALSEFYDKSSINEQLRMQARFNELQTSQLDKRQMTGIDYELLYAIVNVQPSLFVITKGMRRSPNNVDLLAAYYILDGTVYQTPDLHTLVSNRILTSLHHVQKLFDGALADSRYHPALGHYWKEDEALYVTDKEASAHDRKRKQQFATGLDALIADSVQSSLDVVASWEEDNNQGVSTVETGEKVEPAVSTG
ncbi:uncharacterized protein SPPG_00525 [Spizellomyces punctatus DAOM BR117]|uniref:Mediator of RNA polymerase II transcription subunit 6 n=1 Tax=Spizellomyces punctatus (strain DAOM BR117) TaxID=645134 RepID=A0A0L0HUP1_SPIPD|nr:uncharacterized protein SPPG_00525 [Spizellomyces punctatus DAOM BR117]KND04822.1 hypothetical protein SPPG_00525 [Spizellomyces punctatus DAOM BR117]|eukprot:XP_016612861.1 hypothetical protein SPPG_00525 [Spizellomyces punctatus DAOM BR117]